MPGSDSLRATGDRIATLLEQLLAATDGPVSERIEELLRLVTELYGEALARVVGLADRRLLAQLTADDLVASLMLVHGLHPVPLAERVGAALEGVRPYLGSHGGDVELLGVDADRVRLRMLGSCDGCPSSAVTLKLAVEQAILAAAPEVLGIDVEGAALDGDGTPGSGPTPRGVPVRLGRKEPGRGAGGGPRPSGPGRGAEEGRPDGEAAGTWAAVGGLAGLIPGLVKAVDLDGYPLIVCRVGPRLYAYEDSCPACGSDLAGASLQGEVLRCATCRAAFDVRLAGRSLDGTADHLAPRPLLEDEGGVRIAVASGAPG